MASDIISSDYLTFLSQIKDKIRSAQLRAALAVNSEVIHLYWYIGKQVIAKQQEAKWGSKFIETLSHDLRNAFPETKGFSVTNLKYMRIFAENYADEISQPSVDQLPWGHIVVLLLRVKGASERDWYIQQTIENGWSRSTLESYIKQALYKRQALHSNKASNFLERLPYPQSGLAQEMLKNPYNFDFLGLHKDALEREIEYGLTQHITKFLTELGKGFAFVGKQVPIEVEDEEFFIDMLFYHLKLRCYVVIELKATAFKPDHAGQLNFYLTAVDRHVKAKDDNPTIGLLLCKSRKKFIAEYALQGIQKPIGVSEYQLTKAIPENLQVSLPTIEEIETELSNISDDETSRNLSGFSDKKDGT
jgi:predicted nuclease of restriction endonuclease-like (RecB) superfamily